MKKIRAGLVGSAGLSAEVLIKLLARHKNVEISALVSESHAGTRISEIHKSLKGIVDKKTVSHDPEKMVLQCDVIFFSKPHITGIANTAELVALAKKKGKSTKFIDLSGDFRLKNVPDFEKWYVAGSDNKAKAVWKKQKGSAQYRRILKDAAYGLCELRKNEIKRAYFVANPGCYPTAAVLGIAPLLKEGIVSGSDIVINACSGISGAGRTGKVSLDLKDDILPYKIGTHQHIPEIEQELSLIKGGEGKVKVSFAPHVCSFEYGILSTIYLKMIKSTNMDYLSKIYKDFYKACPFIRIKGENYPSLEDIVRTNFCDIGFTIDKRNERIAVVTALDNLYKGASGQAVQNMNIMFSLAETEGLKG